MSLSWMKIHHTAFERSQVCIRPSPQKRGMLGPREVLGCFPHKRTHRLFVAARLNEGYRRWNDAAKSWKWPWASIACSARVVRRGLLTTVGKTVATCVQPVSRRSVQTNGHFRLGHSHHGTDQRWYMRRPGREGVKFCAVIYRERRPAICLILQYF